MLLAKRLLLGSAAALATAAGAQAADLPVRKAAPVAVDYVRVCSTYGSGFFVIPGTESCVKIGGRVRAEALAQKRFSRQQDTFGFRARGRMSFDVRTPTPYGLLRTFVRFQITADSGTPYLGGTTGPGPVRAPILDQGFIQFGGLTAGRTVSFFANPDLPNEQFGTLRFDDAPDVTLFAYTYAFADGFSATLSAEDPWARRVVGSPFGTDPLGLSAIATQQPQGFRMPDVVGNVRYAGTWGSAQISGALHEVTDIGVDRRNDAHEIGFAVAGTVSVNLHQIAADDAAWLAVTYTDGAVQYMSGGNSFGGTGATLGFEGNTPFRNGAGNNFPVTDAYLRRGGLNTTEAFAVAGGVRHYWVPSSLRSNLFGSWATFDHGGGALPVVAPGNVRFGYPDFDELRVGGNLIWSPVSGLDIGAEVIYTNIQSDRSNIRIIPGGRIRDEEDTFEGRLRVQRDF
jgi:hypothetical protein